MKSKPPKNLDRYTDAETAATLLEVIAMQIRRSDKERVLWTITVKFWDDRWRDPSYTPACGYVIPSLSYTNATRTD